jgi:hypothetical protein
MLLSGYSIYYPVILATVFIKQAEILTIEWFTSQVDSTPLNPTLKDKPFNWNMISSNLD